MADKNIEVIAPNRANALKEVSETFGVVTTVRTLQKLMNEVTKEKITPDSVNAACNCVANLNLTIKTSIQAAKFLSDQKVNDAD